MGHNLFAKAYAEMKDAKYNPDGTLKDTKATKSSAQDTENTESENKYGPAIICESRIGECRIQ